MRIGILACSVFEPELEKVLQDIKIKQLFKDNIEVTYLHFGLHTNLDKLEKIYFKQQGVKYNKALLV